MAVIDLSAGWVTNMMPRMFKLGSTTQVVTPAVLGLLNGAYGYSGAGIGTICLMKGTPPASPSSQTTVNARNADVLCRFQAGTQAPGDFITAQVNVNPAIISTQYVAAIASGTSTWFWWYVVPTLGSGLPDNTATLQHQIVGTVGITGSGSDLEMASVAITSGEMYRIVNLRLQFPTTWSY